MCSEVSCDDSPILRHPHCSQDKRRCLIPADGFFEWKKGPRSKQPFCFEVGDGSLFAFAGLWDRWLAPDGQVIESCAILTTGANKVLEDVHDRMPVILPPEEYDLWLDPGIRDATTVLPLLQPFDPNLMRRFPVSTRVNLVTNDDQECSAPIDLPASPALLFD